MIYLYLFGTCFHFIYVFMIIGNNTVVGANSLIIKKTKDGFTYVGSPALKVEY